MEQIENSDDRFPVSIPATTDLPTVGDDKRHADSAIYKPTARYTKKPHPEGGRHRITNPWRPPLRVRAANVVLRNEMVAASRATKSRVRNVEKAGKWRGSKILRQHPIFLHLLQRLFQRPTGKQCPEKTDRD